jgi:hypothetical protein
MKTSAWDMRKVKKINHPRIEEWATKHNALENEMRTAIGKMTDSELQALRHATSSLTSTNCWYAEYDVKETLEGLLYAEEQTRIRNRSTAAEDKG